jgi:hypothetical protein
VVPYKFPSGSAITPARGDSPPVPEKPLSAVNLPRGVNSHGVGANGEVLREIERMEQVVGKRMYRGLLKSLARVWNPKDIQDPQTQERVLAQLQVAERGLRRAESAREKVGLAAFVGILGSLRLTWLSVKWRTDALR